MEYLRLEIYKEKCLFWFIFLDVKKSKIRQPYLAKVKREKHIGE